MKDLVEKIKMHGSYKDADTLAHQGASEFLSGRSNFPAQNPITKTGTKVMEAMQREYGAKKGKSVFYASINKGKKGSSKWHR
jgi:hypothetical protein